jgi:hypothetical protein
MNVEQLTFLGDDEQPKDPDNTQTESPRPSLPQNQISTLKPDEDKEKPSEENLKPDSVTEYFESIAPKVIELTTENFGLYKTLYSTMRKSKLEIEYDSLNKVHYKKNTPLFMVKNLTLVLKERGLPNDPGIVGEILRDAISSGLIIKEGEQTKDHYDFYRLNPHVKKRSDIDEGEADRIFANHIRSLAEFIEKEEITQITDENLQDTLPGF